MSYEYITQYVKAKYPGQSHIHVSIPETDPFIEVVVRDGGGGYISLDYCMAFIESGSHIILPNKTISFEDPAFALDIAKSRCLEARLYE